MELFSEDILFLLLLFSEQQSMVPGKGAVKGSMLQQIAGFLNSILALTGGCISILAINSPIDRNIHSGVGFQLWKCPYWKRHRLSRHEKFDGVKSRKKTTILDAWWWQELANASITGIWEKISRIFVECPCKLVFFCLSAAISIWILLLSYWIACRTCLRRAILPISDMGSNGSFRYLLYWNFCLSLAVRIVDRSDTFTCRDGALPLSLPEITYLVSILDSTANIHGQTIWCMGGYRCIRFVWYTSQLFPCLGLKIWID